MVQVPTPYGPALYMVAGSAMFVADRMQSEAIDVGSSSMGLTQWNDWDGESWVYVVVPLYAVFAAVAVPTLLVWRFWPKPARPRHCRCGNDLMGNTSGVCSECGRGAGEAA